MVTIRVKKPNKFMLLGLDSGENALIQSQTKTRVHEEGVSFGYDTIKIMTKLVLDFRAARHVKSSEQALIRPDAQSTKNANDSLAQMRKTP